MFLDLIGRAGTSMELACKEIGSSVQSVWRWRRADAKFDAAVTETWYAADARRVEHVESAFLNKLLAGNGTTGEWALYLCNRAPHRWRDVRHVVIDADYMHRDEVLEVVEGLARDVAEIVASEKEREEVVERARNRLAPYFVDDDGRSEN